MKKILIFNVIAILVILIISEIVSYHVLVNRYRDDIIAFNQIQTRDNPSKIINPRINYIKMTDFDKDKIISELRPIEYRNNNKPPIILFGCSFTYGFGLNKAETFSRKLADYTNRTVINRGANGTGISFMYYQLNDEEISKNFPQNTEYVIYTLIPDHFERLFRYRSWILAKQFLLRYKLDGDNNLVKEKIKNPLIHSLFTSIILEEFIEKVKAADIEAEINLANRLFEESYKKIREQMPNAKFIILYLKNSKDSDNMDTFVSNLENIDKENIRVIYINELIPDIAKDRDCWIEDNEHPSAKAWDKIVPVLSKQLGL